MGNWSVVSFWSRTRLQWWSAFGTRDATALECLWELDTIHDYTTCLLWSLEWVMCTRLMMSDALIQTQVLYCTVPGTAARYSTVLYGYLFYESFSGAILYKGFFPFLEVAEAG